MEGIQIRITRRIIIINLLLFLLVAFIPFVAPNSKIFADNFQLPLIIPLEGDISVEFREEYYDQNDKVTRKHTGVDINGKYSQEVIASGDGIVTYIGFSPIGGRTIVIKHNDKLKTTYLNLKDIFVLPNQKVKQGQVIAKIGSKDDPSNLEFHLHFGIIFDDFYLDPVDLFNINYKNISKYLRLQYIENDFRINYIK